jgi:hypothetical protein
MAGETVSGNKETTSATITSSFFTVTDLPSIGQNLQTGYWSIGLPTGTPKHLFAVGGEMALTGTRTSGQYIEDTIANPALNFINSYETVTPYGFKLRFNTSAGLGNGTLGFRTLNGTTDLWRINESGTQSMLHTSGNQFFSVERNSSGQGSLSLYSNGRITHQLYAGGNSFINAGGGNVGIGMDNPFFKLDVAGKGNFTASVTGVTEVTADNSTKLASTAFVKNQGYLTSSSGVTSISGTADQVVASAATGAITLSLPQSIATNSSPTFSGLEILSSTNASTPAPVMTSLQKMRIANPTAGMMIYCTDCIANDGSTGVTQTYNGKQWKNHW